SFDDVLAQISSPDVQAIFRTMVAPGKLPAPDGALVDVLPAYRAAMAGGRAALLDTYRETFERHYLDGLLFPVVPILPMLANPEASSPANFERLIRNTDPGSNAGLPGLALPAGLSAGGPPRAGRRHDAGAGAGPAARAGGRLAAEAGRCQTPAGCRTPGDGRGGERGRSPAGCLTPGERRRARESREVSDTHRVSDTLQ